MKKFLLNLVIVLFFSFGFNISFAYADDYTTKQAELDTTVQLLNNALTDLDNANIEYENAIQAKEEATTRADMLQKDIDEKTESIAEDQARLSNRIKDMYTADGNSFLNVLVSSTSFEDFANNLYILNYINKQDSEMIQNLKEERAELSSEKEEYQNEISLAEEQAAIAQEKQEEASQKAQELQNTYNSLSSEVQEQVLSSLSTEDSTTLAFYSESQETVVSQDEIVYFDENTGYATLSDGTTAKVVGYDSSTGNAIVDLAMSFVGGTYSWGAEDAANSTFDCSGLVQYVYSQSGIEVGGHNDLAILNAGTIVDEPEAGDICWWEGHVAIYTGDGMMVSADNEESGITYRAVSDGATYVRY